MLGCDHRCLGSCAPLLRWCRWFGRISRGLSRTSSCRRMLATREQGSCTRATFLIASCGGNACGRDRSRAIRLIHGKFRMRGRPSLKRLLIRQRGMLRSAAGYEAPRDTHTSTTRNSGLQWTRCVGRFGRRKLDAAASSCNPIPLQPSGRCARGGLRGAIFCVTVGGSRR